MTVSGYVPFYNNAPTVLAAVNSLRRQDKPLDEIFAVDDGSTDNGTRILEAVGVRVLKQPDNLGRGAARARAMTEAKCEFVVCCDATNVMPINYCSTALRWFEDPRVGAVYGRISQPAGGNAVTRWRGRHLFQMPKSGGLVETLRRDGTLATYGAVVRRSACLEVGNFDARRRHTEDADLGERLKMRGFDILFDPRLEVHSIVSNGLAQVLERYWRWYAGKDEGISLVGYLRTVWYSVRVMAARDLEERDAAAAAISVLVPHYQFWRSVFRKGRTLSRSFGKDRFE